MTFIFMGIPVSRYCIDAFYFSLFYLRTKNRKVLRGLQETRAGFNKGSHLDSYLGLPLHTLAFEKQVFSQMSLLND